MYARGKAIIQRIHVVKTWNMWINGSFWAFFHMEAILAKKALLSNLIAAPAALPFFDQNTFRNHIKKQPLNGFLAAVLYVH